VIKLNNTFFLILLLIALLNSDLWAIRIKLDGFWVLSLSETNLQNHGGSDLISEYESSENEVLMKITNARGKNWNLEVRYSSTELLSDSSLFVKRTGPGLGNPNSSISGGLEYLEITDNWQELFTGNRRRTKIPIQFKINGISTSYEAQSYFSSIEYRVSTVN